MNPFRRIAFNLWYFRQPPWDTNQTPPELFSFISHHAPGRALDVGCGTGTNTITLAQNGWQVVGIDFASKAIRTARRKAKQIGVSVKFFVDDVTHFRHVKSDFDLILDIGCFHSLDEAGKNRYCLHVDRLLKPGGDFLIYLFFKDGAAESFSGVVEADLEHFTSRWELISREDGTERGQRLSAWLHYRKPNS